MQTLNHVKGDFHWIVVEDATECGDRVRNLVEKKLAIGKGKGYTLLAAQMPPVFRRMSAQVPLPRGVAGRRVFNTKLSLISICISVLQFAATVKYSEKCTISSQFAFQS